MVTHVHGLLVKRGKSLRQLYAQTGDGSSTDPTDIGIKRRAAAGSRETCQTEKKTPLYKRRQSLTFQHGRERDQKQKRSRSRHNGTIVTSRLGHTVFYTV